MDATQQAFEEFVRAVEPSIRRALVAGFGLEIGREATADALAYAWIHWQRVQGMENAAGYLYRVGRSRALRYLRKQSRFRSAKAEATWEPPDIEPELWRELRRLPNRQQTAVVLVHGFEWRVSEVAALLGISASTVQNHLKRGTSRLRDALEESADAHN